MTDLDAAPPPPKLPLGEAISLSYAWFVQKFPDVLRISWLWLVITAVLVGSASMLEWTRISVALGDTTNGDVAAALMTAPAPIWTTMLIYVAGGFPLFAGVSIAVAWHRRIILGERPGVSGANVVTRELWRYAATAIALGMITMLPFVLLMAVSYVSMEPPQDGGVANPPTHEGGVFIILVVILYFAAAAAMLRLSMLLPACAIGDTALTVRAAWRRTRGNTWRLFWGLVVCTLPPSILIEIVTLVALPVADFAPAATRSGLSLPVVMTLMSMIFFVAYLLIVPIGIGFLSQAYRHFFQGGLNVAGEPG